MKKTIVIVMILTLFSKSIGFIRDIILAYFYGASAISDVFIIAIVIPTIIFGVIGAGISSSYIPILSSIENKYGLKEGEKFTNGIINLLLAFSMFVFVFSILFTEPLVKLFASGFEGDTLKLAVSFLRITIITMFFTGLIYLFSGYLQLKDHHVVPGIMGLPLNIVLIFTIFLSSTYSIYLLPVGQVLATLLQFSLLFYFVCKTGFKFKPHLGLRNKHIKKVTVLAVPVMFGSSFEQINNLIDRTLASQVAEGGISALNYASQLNMFVQGVFVTSIGVVFYPVISRLAAQGNMENLRRTVSQTMILIMVLILPITIGTLLFSKQIIELLFGRGAFTLNAITMTSSALFYYSFGMVAIGLRMVLTRTFFSLQDTRTPMINSIWAVLINIGLNITLSKYMGLSGLALATSMSASFCTLLLFRSLVKKIGFFELRKLINTFTKVAFVSVLMGIFSKAIFHLLHSNLNANMSLLLTIFLSIICYTVLIYYIRIKEIDEFFIDIKRRVKLAS